MVLFSNKVATITVCWATSLLIHISNLAAARAAFIPTPRRPPSVRPSDYSTHHRWSSTTITTTLFMAENQPQHNKPEHVVIAGTGIIGLCTAYYLQTQHHIAQITFIDPSGTVAPAASGKAGGFLARDWNNHGPTERLTHRSFDLHAQLAQQLGGADVIQYRPLTCVSVQTTTTTTTTGSRGTRSHNKPSGAKLRGVEWAAGDHMASVQSLGDEHTIAQVHPKKLCAALWQALQTSRCDVHLIQGAVTGVEHQDLAHNSVGAVLSDQTIVWADALLLACGPWSAAMQGVKYHSVIVPTQKKLSQCVFFAGNGDPEVYVRPDRTAYLTGFPEPARTVTEAPGHEAVDPSRIQTIVEAVRQAATSSDSSTTTTTTQNAMLMLDQPVVTQACYLPTTDDGVPVMGRVPLVVAAAATTTTSAHTNQPAVYMAAGHSCWGILLGPASGEAMATLIATGHRHDHVDLRPFDPARYADQLQRQIVGWTPPIGMPSA